MFKKDIVDSPHNELLFYERLFYKNIICETSFYKRSINETTQVCVSRVDFLMNASVNSNFFIWQVIDSGKGQDSLLGHDP